MPNNSRDCVAFVNTSNVHYLTTHFIVTFVAYRNPDSQLHRTSPNPLNLPPQHPPHLPRHPRPLLIIQIIPLPPPKHSPTPALDLRLGRRPRDDVEMHVRDDLRRARAVVLHDVVVGYARDFGDCAREEGKPEAWMRGVC